MHTDHVQFQNVYFLRFEQDSIRPKNSLIISSFEKFLAFLTIDFESYDFLLDVWWDRKEDVNFY